MNVATRRFLQDASCECSRQVAQRECIAKGAFLSSLTPKSLVPDMSSYQSQVYLLPQAQTPAVLQLQPGGQGQGQLPMEDRHPAALLLLRNHPRALHQGLGRRVPQYKEGFQGFG